ncbi:hypothetical protein LB506_000161 [Fusarium annulatum]|uniref:Uncharacterized protein n=1 Tax=Gibberella intermedia TaxID=948311 RepID=A0A365MT06_GIBIN|nr:hypothetical protein LB506_000161 [Fusarium annulatum]RBA11687.1 hypothetical protein FPRO05_04859 [Fusarium proliferatum]
MSQKCVHQGCGKEFTDPDEKCEYHPGPPIFHEGQKGWKCCKPRVLTFDEFMDIPPCTTGTHSTTDKPPQLEEKPQQDDAALAQKIDALNAATPSRAPIPTAQHAPTPPPPAPESEDDDPSLEIADGVGCKRRACGATYKKGSSRDDEECVHHPGVPIFHEGSKGYSCCKRRVLEFDQFMKIEGCKTKNRHLFVGSGKKDGANSEEVVSNVRHDFYQTPVNVIASFFLKKIDKSTAKIELQPKQLNLDLTTTDSPPKRYTAQVPLYASIDPEKSSYRVLGTKLEFVLAKSDGTSWPVLRGDEALTEDAAQIARNVSGFTAFDVLNYTKVESDDAWKLEVPLRILCVGDSITEGWGSDADGGDGNGYRLSLAKHLSREKVVFAGTRRKGSMEDSYYAAWSGKTIQYINDHITESLEQNPNLVLLHAGTNDMDLRPSISKEGNDPKDAATRLGDLIDKIVRYCPDAVILVAIPLASCDTEKPRMPIYRALIPGLVRQRRKDGDHVIAVDFSTFDLGELRDCLHPTNEGYSIMGDYWYDFITQVPKRWIKEPVGDDPKREENGVGRRVLPDKMSILGIGLYWGVYRICWV